MAARVLLALGEGCGALRYRLRLSPLAQWEIVSGDRYSEVVQRDKGLWIYSARHWRQGRVRPYLGRRESGSEQSE